MNEKDLKIPDLKSWFNPRVWAVLSQVLCDLLGLPLTLQPNQYNSAIYLKALFNALDLLRWLVIMGSNNNYPTKSFKSIAAFC
jgi:hypothetical protein